MAQLAAFLARPPSDFCMLRNIWIVQLPLPKKNKGEQFIHAS